MDGAQTDDLAPTFPTTARANAGDNRPDMAGHIESNSVSDATSGETCWTHSRGGEHRMKAEELRALQAPLKERYRADPGAALITLRAQGRLGDGVRCKVETGKALVEAGLHPATGGTGIDACSGDMLLEALVACAGVTLNAVATALDIPLRDASIAAEGDLDFRGTLGQAKDAPVGFQAIRLKFLLDTDASEEELASLLRLTERYCVVLQTLARPPALEVSRTSLPSA